MLAHALEASSRAFGMLVFVILWMSSANSSFPSNWLALGILYVLLILVALLYELMTSPQPKLESTPRFFPIPKLVVIGVGVALFALTYMSYFPQIDAIFYPGRYE
jgi:hypothetical protein